MKESFASFEMPVGCEMVVSFDIDGTMEFGHPPGPVTVESVRALAGAGHVVGSASDRTRGDQAALWAGHGIEVAFIGGKHHLEEVRGRFPADRHVHVGDGHVDEHYARLAGFEFLFPHELGALPPDPAPGDGPARRPTG